MRAVIACWIAMTAACATTQQRIGSGEMFPPEFESGRWIARELADIGERPLWGVNGPEAYRLVFWNRLTRPRLVRAQRSREGWRIVAIDRAGGSVRRTHAVLESDFAIAGGPLARLFGSIGRLTTLESPLEIDPPVWLLEHRSGDSYQLVFGVGGTTDRRIAEVCRSAEGLMRVGGIAVSPPLDCDTL